MFVLNSTYQKLKYSFRILQSDYSELAAKYESLRQEWNALVEEINEKGGRDFLDSEPESRLDDTDIQKLLMLCHPDKHDGKPMATEMAVKLLRIKNRKGK